MGPRARLEGELAEVRRRLADLPTAYDEAKARIAALEKQLAELTGEVPDELLAEAQAALAAGDTTEADDLFAEVEAKQEQAIETAAKAAFARGEIAEGEIRWAEAAEHFARAADLAPQYERLFAASVYSRLSGDYVASLRFGASLLNLANNDGSTSETEKAKALNVHAITFNATVRSEEAEPLYREALEIRRRALGEDHPDFALSLNNLAHLLWATGRYEEAEPLYREALEIVEAALGPEHSDSVMVRENLDVFLAERPD